MKNKLKTIKPEEISKNTFQLIGKEWMLITAGNIKSFNTMTAAWGHFGVLWSKPVAVCFIRPNRYTYKYTEQNDYFTLCFFEEKFKDVLTFCGTRSGRDTDKIKETGLVPAETSKGNIYFKQARLILECKKIYYDDIKPENFLDQKIHESYPLKDYHRMYVGEIIDCYQTI